MMTLITRENVMYTSLKQQHANSTPTLQHHAWYLETVEYCEEVLKHHGVLTDGEDAEHPSHAHHW